MKLVHWIAGIILSFSIITILLITSLQVAMYGDFGFYEKEYEKYDVLTDLDMKMDDVMYVTHEMMSYLKGDRETLEVVTTVEGKKQDFFNEQDRLHMKDVQGLFIGGLHIRTGAIAILLLCVVTLLLTKAKWKYLVPRAFLLGTAFTAIGSLLLTYLFLRDFTAAFTKFHEIFFTNDLWLFDPAEDYMIRMLPEGLFSDMVIRIGVIFSVGLVVLLMASIIWKKKTDINRAN